MKIVAIEPIGISQNRAEEIKSELAAKGHEFVFFNDRNENKDVVAERMKDAEMVIVSNIPIPADVLSKCPKLRF